MYSHTVASEAPSLDQYLHHRRQRCAANLKTRRAFSRHNDATLFGYMPVLDCNNSRYANYTGAKGEDPIHMPWFHSCIFFLHCYFTSKCSPSSSTSLHCTQRLCLSLLSSVVGGRRMSSLARWEGFNRTAKLMRWPTGLSTTKVSNGAVFGAIDEEVLVCVWHEANWIATVIVGVVSDDSTRYSFIFTFLRKQVILEQSALVVVHTATEYLRC